MCSPGHRKLKKARLNRVKFWSECGTSDILKANQTTNSLCDGEWEDIDLTVLDFLMPSKCKIF